MSSEEEKKEVCDHKNYFMGFGFEIVPNSEGGFACLTAQNCVLCGEVIIKMTTIGAPTATPTEEKKIIH